MKVILAVGAPFSLHEQVFNSLQQFGVATALPTRYESRGASDLSGFILENHKVDPNGPAGLEALRPGKLWTELGVDLFMANVGNPRWGWADHRAVPLMEFWADLDSQVNLVLCYESPNAYLARAIRSVPAPTAAEIEAALGDWQRWNAFLLEHFQAHRDRCLLVDSREVLRAPSRLAEKLNAKWGWDLSQIVTQPPAGTEEDFGQVKEAATGSPSPDPAAGEVLHPVSHHLARGYIAGGHVVWALARQLDEEADIVDIRANAPEVALQEAWADWVAVQDELKYLARASRFEEQNARLLVDLADVRQGAADLSSMLEQNALQLQSLRDENESLKGDVERLRIEKEEHVKAQESAEYRQLSDQLAKLTGRFDEEARVNVRAAELVMENEHLMVALHQIQEDMEKLLLNPAAVEAQALTAEVADAAPEADPQAAEPAEPVPEISIDMRRPIEGENWYDAEHDGRWAGPALQSSIQLPPLNSGSYDMELCLADAIAPDIVYGLRIEAFGTDVPFEFSHAATREAFPIVCRAKLEVPPVAAVAPWTLGLHFPRTVSPSESGSPDQRQLAIRVSGLQLKPAGEALADLSIA